MFLLKYFTFIVLVSAFINCDDVNNELDVDTPTEKLNKEDAYLISKTALKSTYTEAERVNVEVYYETLCPDCVHFFINDLRPVVESMHEYINLNLYPYGNAKTKENNGQFVITCQHGQQECYGNKLHACAIDLLQNVTKSALYTCCMMGERSDDEAANECGQAMQIDADPIIKCAKGDKGNSLLKHYGDLTHEKTFRGVPFVLVNNERFTGDDFKQDVCDAFTNPPPPCTTTGVSKKIQEIINFLDFLVGNHVLPNDSLFQ